MSFKNIACALLALAATPAGAAEPNPAPPSAELLEFMADFQDDDGVWIDPFRVLETLRELTEKEDTAGPSPASLKSKEISNE